jgi:hypothetical protein
MKSLASSRPRLVIVFALIIAVIDHGRSQGTSPAPLGFTRIARDLGRRFCDAECEEYTHVMMR